MIDISCWEVCLTVVNYLTVIFTLTLTEKTFDGCFLILLILIQKRNIGSQALSFQPLRYYCINCDIRGNKHLLHYKEVVSTK